MMATHEDEKIQELNFLIKSLGERGKESQKWKKHDEQFWNLGFHMFSETLSKVSGNGYTFQAYGSAAEDLKSEEPDDVGDVDIVMFPDSDNLLIHDEMIEYLPGNPMHVRIKGVGHGLLKFCCVKDTGYVSTSALKDSHDLIYGSSSLGNLLPYAFQLMSREEPSATVPLICHVKSSINSPAIKANFSMFPDYFNSNSIPSVISGSPSHSFQLQEKARHRQIAETKVGVVHKIEEKQNGGPNENETKSKGEATFNGESNTEDKKSQLETMRKRTTAVEHLCRHLFRNMKKEKEDPVSEPILNETEKSTFSQNPVAAGIDYVPAFSSRGWPKVAQEWIKRERKWPAPDIIDKVIQEGFHLVAKAPKNGGNPECDFRISFAHAEYLLSQQMNEIQRECFRCLKKFHRSYLSTEPKGLVTFHLKNLFLQTIEETGAEMWCESNSAECMMKLLENLLEALGKKNLRHFFVRSYNLFCVDYIEDPVILKSLEGKVQQIMKNPMLFLKEMFQKQHVAKDKSVPQNDLTSTTKPTRNAQGHYEESSPYEGRHEFQSKQIKANHQSNSPFSSYRYYNLKGIYLAISKELADTAFDTHRGDTPLETLHTHEASLVQDFREIARETDFNAEEFLTMLDICWNIVYFKVLLSSESDIRRRMLDGIQSVVEIWKYLLKQDEFLTDNEERIFLRMLDPTAGDPFDWEHIIPAGGGRQLARMLSSNYRPESSPVQPERDYIGDIPLD